MVDIHAPCQTLSYAQEGLETDIDMVHLSTIMALPVPVVLVHFNSIDLRLYKIISGGSDGHDLGSTPSISMASVMCAHDQYVVANLCWH